MFTAEVRFYREIAPVIGLRVPACYRAEHDGDGTLLVLEDLSAWTPGADPVAFATILRDMHARWSGVAAGRWPWLRPIGAGAAEVAALYAEVWPSLSEHPGLSTPVRQIGVRLLARLPAVAPAGPTTLCHGDASMQNARTSGSGEIALLDWEDVTAGYGIDDLAWLLVSSVPPERWDETIDAYGTSDGLNHAWPDAIQQGLFSLSDDPFGPDADGWCARLAEAAHRL